MNYNKDNTNTSNMNSNYDNEISQVLSRIERTVGNLEARFESQFGPSPTSAIGIGAMREGHSAGTLNKEIVFFY
jgi:hypothetical protein